jgi:hypothetical protein
MPTETRKLVIRAHRPWLRGSIWAVLAIVTLAAIYIAFEGGRRRAGHDSLAAWQQRRELQAKIVQLEKTNTALRTKVAELETGQVSGRQESSELARTVSELQGQVARQNQDLAFYRGIVSSSVGGTSVRINRVVVVPGSAPDQFSVRVVLVQTVQPEKNVSGTMTFSLEGIEQHKPATYPLARLTADKREQLKFSFRYYEDLDQQLVLPKGFQPATVHVEVRAADRTGEPLTQTFEWRVQET